MGDIRERLASWMQGRYGEDELNRFLVGIAVVCIIIELIFGTGVFGALAWIPLIVSLWRSFSHNLSKRQDENARFLASTEKPRRAGRQAMARWRNRKTTLYFKCDGCKTWLSVPRGKGTLRVVCPHCKKEMKKKS